MLYRWFLSGGAVLKDNSDKIILDLCGGTGAWSRPYKESGYDVRLITLPEWDVTQVDFLENGYLLFRNQAGGRNMLIRAADVYGILAAPPCTEFSLAKNTRPRNFCAGMMVVDACVKIIWKCRLSGSLKFWTLENPVGFLRQFLGRPHFTFEQWQFGEPLVKKTDIWGYFNEPRPTVKERPADIVRLISHRKNAACWTTCYEKVPDWYNGPKLDRAARRAITPPGFAEAFFKANR